MPARVAIVCALLAWALSARADRRPVAVIDLSGAEPAKVLAQELYKVLFNHLDLQPMGKPDVQAALLGGFEDEDRPPVERARTYKQEAEDYLAQLDYRNAGIAAERGMDQLAFVIPVSEVLGLYAELAFADGQALLGQRKPNDASLAFALAARLDPSRRPDPTRYEPAIITAYRNAVNKPAIPTKLEVTGAGRVWIDGVERGIANATFETTEGIHLVQLTGPERETRGERVALPHAASEIPAAPANELLMVKRTRNALKAALDPATRAGAIKRLAELLNVGDAVLILKGEGDKLIVQTWRPQTGFSRRVEHLREQPIDLLTPLAPPRKIEPPTREPKPPLVIEKVWYKRNWVRISAASGVFAAIVGAIAFAVRAKWTDVDHDIKPVGNGPP